MSKLEPMLAAKTTDDDLRRLRFPMLLSPKIDGIRGLVKDSILLSRKFLPIPNPYVQATFGMRALNGLDGELIVGSPTDKNAMQKSMAVTKQSGLVKATYFVFDKFDAPGGFHNRVKLAEDTVASLNEVYPHIAVRMIPHILVSSYDQLLERENEALLLGYEGVMLRDIGGPYKYGRSTLREGYLLKVKRFVDGEARIIGFTEREHNSNELEQDAFGRAKRSSAQAGQIGTNSLGAFIVQDVVTGQEFKVGSGFTEAQRVNFWIKREQLLGQLVKYKSLPVGVVNKPRIPIFLGFRSEIDT